MLRGSRLFLKRDSWTRQLLVVWGVERHKDMNCWDCERYETTDAYEVATRSPLFVVTQILQSQGLGLALYFGLRPTCPLLLFRLEGNGVNTGPSFQRLDRIRGRDVDERTPKFDSTHNCGVFKRLTSESKGRRQEAQK